MKPPGGSRPNAGRPATHGERKQSLTIRITPTLRTYLAETSAASIAERIETDYRADPAFISWLGGKMGGKKNPNSQKG
jgi:hypothetical protein